MITPIIVDYGVGNLRSVERAFARLDVRATISSRVEDISNANAILLPGVGAFADAIAKLRSSGQAEALTDAGLRGVPLLGICLGMQLLATESLENGRHLGLGLVPGRVTLLSAEEHHLPMPHMGWNDVTPAEGAELFRGIPVGADFYFVHSYCMTEVEASSASATCRYGEAFCCAVERQNVMGVQFHPEKSQKFGRRVLENFLRVAREC